MWPGRWVMGLTFKENGVLENGWPENWISEGWVKNLVLNMELFPIVLKVEIWGGCLSQ